MLNSLLEGHLSKSIKKNIYATFKFYSLHLILHGTYSIAIYQKIKQKSNIIIPLTNVVVTHEIQIV